MITLKKIEWGNFRSYGEDNHLNLDSRTLTQLLGENGAGKTTLPLMLQEVLYGKNIKGIRKESLSNRYTDKPGYWITLYFSSGEVQYCIKLSRAKAKLTLILEENGFDISSHTATATYKTIAKILGIEDFKTFCQLTYQSTTDALDFLTATDTQRKKFLISLLDLSEYLVYHNEMKEHIKGINKQIYKTQGSIESNQKWIDRQSRLSTVRLVEMKVPEGVSSTMLKEIEDVAIQLSNISAVNKRVADNNKYKKDLEALGDVAKKPLLKPDTSGIRMLRDAQAVTKATIDTHTREITSLRLVNTDPNCTLCGQSITVENVSERLLNEIQAREELLELNAKTKISIDKRVEHERLYNKEVKHKKEFELLINLIDQGLSSKPIDPQVETKKLATLRAEKQTILNNVQNVVAHNTEVLIHNAGIDVTVKQLAELEIDIKEKKAILQEDEELVAYLTIIKDAFSTNGLVSYKVEASVKVLEGEINNYLAEFSDFRVGFNLVGEKLNVEVYDDERNILEIQTVSTGELGRINIATGLAIRKLLSTLTSSKLNFLFLDEIVGVLDSKGKETLFDVLQRQDLNTIMVSHEETHPLIPKVEIDKQGKISRLQDDD